MRTRSSARRGYVAPPNATKLTLRLNPPSWQYVHGLREGARIHAEASRSVTLVPRHAVRAPVRLARRAHPQGSAERRIRVRMERVGDAAEGVGQTR